MGGGPLPSDAGRAERMYKVRRAMGHMFFQAATLTGAGTGDAELFHVVCGGDPARTAVWLTSSLSAGAVIHRGLPLPNRWTGDRSHRTEETVAVPLSGNELRHRAGAIPVSAAARGVGLASADEFLQCAFRWHQHDIGDAERCCAGRRARASLFPPCRSHGCRSVYRVSLPPPSCGRMIYTSFSDDRWRLSSGAACLQDTDGIVPASLLR